MKLAINEQVVQKIPGVQVGVIVLKNLNNKRKYTAVDQLLRGVCAQKKNELKNEAKAKDVNACLQKGRIDNLVLTEAQLLESNIRKINRGREIKSLNNLYALTHYFAIKYLVPVYAYDLDRVGADLEVNFIEAKKGKRPEDIDVTPDTVHMVLWFINFGNQTKEDFTKLPEEFVNLIGKYCGGSDADVYILDSENMSVDLGYESELEKENLANAAAEENNKTNEGESDVTDESAEAGESDSGLPAFLKGGSEQKTRKKDGGCRDLIITALEAAVGKWLEKEQITEVLPENIDLETPKDAGHGDFSSPVALKMAKILEKAPHEVASGLVGLLEKPECVEKIEIAGPGFINFHLSNKYLESVLDMIIGQKGNYGRSGMGLGTKVLVEYSSPNIAKPLGVHHLLSTIFGQTMANLFKFAGYETVTLNWPGDWGTQFGKLIYAYKNWGSEEEVRKDPLNELLKLYVKFHNEEEKDPELIEKGRGEFRKLEEGDDENNALWEWFKDISIKELERIYKILGVSFDEYLGERMYLDDAKEVIEEGKQKGIIKEGEKGALIIEFKDEKMPPSMVQKADGTTLYASRDLASIKDRIERLKGQKLVYVIDVAQKLHVQQLFESAKMFNWGDVEMHHMAFGRMQLPEGKMSTRKGDVILLDEVLKEAQNRTSRIVAEKSRELGEEEKNHIAGKMAVSAIKYNIISQNPETNITFDWDRMLSLEGNSGPYLEYAYARAKSILRKSVEEPVEKNITPSNDRQTDLFTLTEAVAEKEKEAVPQSSSQDNDSGAPYSHPSEQALLRMLPGFGAAIEQAVSEYRPNIVSTYLFDLARAFNSFYNEAPVLAAPTEELKKARLKLVEAFVQVLENGLGVLGIDVFERM